DTFTGNEDTTIAGSLAANDAASGDGGNVWSLTSGAAHGTVTVKADGTFSYVPAANYNGPDSFTYTITDADGSTSTATVTLNVTPVNDVPVAAADTFTGNEDTPINGSLATIDTPSVDGGNVWSLTTGAAHGTVTVNADGTFSYVPNANYNGADSFTYKITDADGSTSTATVSLTIAPVNDIPVATADSFSGNEDTTIAGNLSTKDTPSGDGGNVWSVVAGPAHGTVTVKADGTFWYVPNAIY